MGDTSKATTLRQREALALREHAGRVLCAATARAQTHQRFTGRVMTARWQCPSCHTFNRADRMTCTGLRAGGAPCGFDRRGGAEVGYYVNA